jgi:hypothetical protein
MNLSTETVENETVLPAAHSRTPIQETPVSASEYKRLMSERMKMYERETKRLPDINDPSDEKEFSEAVGAAKSTENTARKEQDPDLTLFLNLSTPTGAHIMQYINLRNAGSRFAVIDVNAIEKADSPLWLEGTPTGVTAEGSRVVSNECIAVIRMMVQGDEINARTEIEQQKPRVVNSRRGRGAYNMHNARSMIIDDNAAEFDAMQACEKSKGRTGFQTSASIEYATVSIEQLLPLPFVGKMFEKEIRA